jgi:hypothetical protein
METPNRFLIAEKAISFPILHHYLVYHFAEKKSTLSGRKTTPSLYAIKFIKTSCNSFGIELTQHKCFSKEAMRRKTWFAEMKK